MRAALADSSGRELQLDRRVGDLVELVREVVAGQQSTAHTHRLVVQTAEPTLTGRWDWLRIYRVVENLVSNAIKYSPEGGEIVVALQRAWGPEGDWAVIEVRDKGIGIAAGDLPHVFERFYRGKNAAKMLSGTGMGLAAARQIVEQHGGTIAVESRELVGSTSTVRLPIEAVS